MGRRMPVGVRCDGSQQLRVRDGGAERAEESPQRRQPGARARRRLRAHAARAARQQDGPRSPETGPYH